jgi:hypothetical protein
MAWWNIFGGVGNVLKGGKEVVEVFKESEENKGVRHHEEKMADIDRDLASLQQFNSEFYQRQNRSWWDSFVDGLNRLPRPLITIGVLSFFVLAPLNPAKFLEIAKAYELMPPGYWALISVIVGFYFGGRMQLKSQDMTIRKDALKAAKELTAMKKEFRELDIDSDTPESKIYEAATMADHSKKISNKVVAEWLAQRE